MSHAGPRHPTTESSSGQTDKGAYMAILSGVFAEPDMTMLVRRLNHHLALGYRRFFVDAEETTSGIKQLHNGLFRWGVVRRDTLEQVHILVPSVVAHTRMSITSLFVGSWLRAYTDRVEFLAAARGNAPSLRRTDEHRPLDRPPRRFTNATPYPSSTARRCSEVLHP